MRGAMSLRLLVARARRPIRRLLRDKRGISAVEFAMLLPLMVTLYLGGVEVSQAVAIDRKVTLIARSLGDLVAQATNVTNAEISNILAASAAIVVPYQDTKLNITVSSVKIDSVTTAPPKMKPKSSATTVTRGMSAFRKTCFMITRRSTKPFARAVRT